MRKSIKVSISIYTMLALITSCTSNIPNKSDLKNESYKYSQIISKYSITGKAVFPKQSALLSTVPIAKMSRTKENISFNNKISIKATLEEVGNKATISLIYPPDAGGGNANVTIGTGLTDSSGNFTVNPTVTFNPVTNSIYVLEALKRIGAAGNDVITIRTYIKWNGSGWDSMTTPGLFINSKTTALAIIDSYDGSISSSQTIGTIVIDTPDPGSNPTAVGSVSVATILGVSDLVDNLLTQDVDPLRNISYANSKYFVNREVNHSSNALNAGLDCPNCDLKNESLSGNNYAGLDLSFADLTNADLTNSNLFFTNLTSATLTGADFSGAIWTDGSQCSSGSIGLCKGEFRVNTFITGIQALPSVAMDNNGNFVVTWQSFDQDNLGDYGIYAQRYNSIGVVQGSEFKVNTYTIDFQSHPMAAMDSTGKFVIVWNSYGQDNSDGYGVYAKRYNSNGVVQGSEFKVNTYTIDSQANPSVAMDNNGNFVVTWQSFQDGSGYGVYAKRYTSTGATSSTEFQVNTYTTDYQTHPMAAMDGTGNFVIVWSSYNQDNPGGNDYGIYAQRYTSTGATSGTEFNVNTYTTDSQSRPSVAMDNTGNFVIAWKSKTQDDGSPSDYGIYAQRYTSTGATAGTEFRANTFTTVQQINPSVTMDNTGNFVIAWSSYQESADGIYAQRYNSSGVLQSSEIPVNTYTTDSQANPSIVMDSTGNFVVVWNSYDQDGSNKGIFAKRYNSSGFEQ